MKLIERENIDIQLWDELVSKSPGHSFFSFSWYLDAVAENWCILVDAMYENGIALPYTKRAGIEILYTPIFSRYSELFGELDQDSIGMIKERFRVMELATKEKLFDNDETRIHQLVTNDFEQRINNQAKRSLKRATNYGLTIVRSENPENVLQHINDELKGKYSGITKESLNVLSALFSNARAAGVLNVFEVQLDEEVKGGVVCFQDDHQLLYVKGATDEITKKNGGMYLAINTAIEFAFQHELKFDFGGSNIEGVQRFNYNLGGSDINYRMYIQNDGPMWFKLAKEIKNRLDI